MQAEEIDRQRTQRQLDREIQINIQTCRQIGGGKRRTKTLSNWIWSTQGWSHLAYHSRDHITTPSTLFLLLLKQELLQLKQKLWSHMLLGCCNQLLLLVLNIWIDRQIDRQIDRKKDNSPYGPLNCRGNRILALPPALKGRQGSEMVDICALHPWARAQSQPSRGKK